VTTSGRPHNYVKYVMDRCRCEVCRKDKLEYDQWRRAERKAGRSRLVDAEPVRQHVFALGRQGMGVSRVARASGVPEFTMKYLIKGDPSRSLGPAKQVSVMTAKKILAVTFDLSLLSERSLIDATGMRRRLQALVAAGWTTRYISGRLGMAPNNAHKLFTQDTVRVETYRLAVEVHRELWDKQPPQDTVTQRRWVRQSKQRAAQNGWVPTAAWDDVDDLNEIPQQPVSAKSELVDEVAVRRVLAGGDPSTLNRAEKAAAARALAARGDSASAVAAHLRMSHRTVRKVVAA